MLACLKTNSMRAHASYCCRSSSDLRPRRTRAAGRSRAHSVVDRQCGELLGPAIEDCIGADHERAGSQLGQGCEDRIEIAFGAGMQDMQLHSEDAGRRLQVSQYGLGIGIGWVDERG